MKTMIKTNLKVLVDYRICGEQVLCKRLVSAVGDVLVELSFHAQQSPTKHTRFTSVILDTF